MSEITKMFTNLTYAQLQIIKFIHIVLNVHLIYTLCIYLIFKAYSRVDKPFFLIYST